MTTKHLDFQGRFVFAEMLQTFDHFTARQLLFLTLQLLGIFVVYGIQFSERIAYLLSCSYYGPD